MEITDAMLAALPFELRAEIDENICRKGFSETELAEFQRQIIELWSAAELKKQGQRTDLIKDTSTAGAVEVAKPTRHQNVTEKVARVFGESEKSTRKRLAVAGAAKANPEQFGKLAAEMDRTGRVNGVYKKLVTAQKAEAIKAEPAPMPAGPYRVIVADPPWSYDNRATDSSHRAANPYPDMSIDDICAMQIGGIAHDDSVLWLWTTNSHLREAFRVVEAWGFVYKTMLTWAKDRMGTGDWLRGQTEHCLLAVRGRPTITLSNQTTLLRGPLREHSRKPDEFFQMVEGLCPGSKVELFCREQRPGWAAHGDEVSDVS